MVARANAASSFRSTPQRAPWTDRGDARSSALRCGTNRSCAGASPPRPSPGSNTGCAWAASGRQPGADDPRAGSIPSGMGRLLRLQPVAGAAVARRLGPTTPALRRLGPVEDARQAIPGTAPPKRPRTADERSHLQPQGSLADQLLRSPAQGLHQSSLPSSGFANHEARECLIRRTAVYGPVRTVVWEDRAPRTPRQTAPDVSRKAIRRPREAARTPSRDRSSENCPSKNARRPARINIQF